MISFRLITCDYRKNLILKKVFKQELRENILETKIQAFEKHKWTVQL